MSPIRIAPLAALLLLLTGCGSSQQDELQQWMAEQKAQTKPKVQPIPEPKKFSPQPYTQESAVVVRYDGALSTSGGTRVETRRFEAKVPADGTASTVGPALNAAANQVATEIAGWVGG